jgi:hypothetical protein
MITTTQHDDSDAADTLRFRHLDPDETSTYDITPLAARRLDRTELRRRRDLIRRALRDVAGLRAAIAAGWDVGPELAHEERSLAALVATDRR